MSDSRPNPIFTLFRHDEDEAMGLRAIIFSGRASAMMV
jgi:hypothetical protein